MTGFSRTKLATLGAVGFLALYPTFAEAQVNRVIRFDNQCSSPVEFLINHADNGRNWHVHGWYNLRPRQSSTFSANGTTLMQQDGFELYFYARSTDGTGRVWDGSNRQTFQSAQYGFRTMNTSVASDGALEASITCNGNRK